MDIRQALTRHLEANLSLPDCRVHRVRVPAGVPAPYVTLTKISGAEEVAHDGYTGLKQARIQIDAYADTNTAALGVIQEVRAALDPFSNAVMGGAGGVFVSWCEYDGDNDYFDDRTKRFVNSADYIIRYKGD